MLSHFEFTAQNEPHDFHAVSTITFGELVDCGFVDWNSNEWQWDFYSETQRDRLEKKIEARFEYRELDLLPIARWRRQFIRKLNEIMPKYKMLYKKLDDKFNAWQISDNYGKNRHVFSDFPATILQGNTEDYASNANDEEFENIATGPDLDIYVDFAKRYNDVDVLILDELEILFSDLLTVNFNGF